MANKRSGKPSPKRLRSGVQLIELGASRPPCSVAESEMAVAVQRRMRSAGLRPTSERVRAPTSPTWSPLLRSLLRVWAAAFLAAGFPLVTTGLGAGSVILGIPVVSGLLRFVPLLGSNSRNVVALRRGTDRGLRALVVVAHLDSHPTDGAPLSRLHTFLAALSGWAALVVGILARPRGAGWRAIAGVIAAESVVTLLWLARQELKTFTDTPDDNTSGLLALSRLADLIGDGSQLRDVWLVATGGGTSGSYGMTKFLRRHPDLKSEWVIDIDALGTGEVIAVPFGPRFPYPGTPAALVRSVVAAARHTGDPLTIRRVPRPHSEARAALRQRTAAIALTGGLTPPSGATPGPDPANAERAARVVDGLARLNV